jgi:cell division septal protein FtsQ
MSTNPMWVSRKRKNRVHRRRNVLDVKLRSDHVRALRARGLAVMVGVVFGTVFTLYVLWRSGEWVLDRMVYENRAFMIQRVEMSTDGVILLERLRRWSGVQSGQNLMALDLARVKANLELVPNVHSVSVERLLPRTLRIRVMERSPVAQVLLPRITEDDELIMQAWLLDSEGAVMMPLEAKYRRPDSPSKESNLPVLTGVRPREIRLGRAVDSSRLHAALRFVDSFNHSGMGGRIALRQVKLGGPGVLVAVTDSDSEVTLADEQFDAQLMRWQQIHDESLRLRKTILSMDLAVENNVPVRWVDAAPAGSGRPI